MLEKVLEKSAVEHCWTEVLETTFVGKCCMDKSVGENCGRRVLQKRVVEQCCKEMLGKRMVLGEECGTVFWLCGLVLKCGFGGGKRVACSLPPESLSLHGEKRRNC